MPHTPEDDEDDEADQDEQNKNKVLLAESPKGPATLTVTEKRHVSHENLKVGIPKKERSSSLRSSIASSKSSLLQQSFDRVSPLPDDSSDALDGISETEVAVMERTSRFKISTEAPITASQKSSFEKRSSYDRRSSTEGRRSAESSEERPHHEGRVSIDGRGRDNAGLVGRLYSKETGDDSYTKKNLVTTRIVQNELADTLSAHPSRTNKMACSLDEEDNSDNDSKELRPISSSLSEQDQSFMSRVRKFAAPSRRTCAGSSDDESRKLSVRSNADGLRVNIKRTRSKSVADQPSNNRTFSIAKSKINFRSTQNPCAQTKVDEAKVLGTSSKLHPITLETKNVERLQSTSTHVSQNSSPTESEACEANGSSGDKQNKFQGGQKKFSLSLDMLPSRHNGKFKREGHTTPQNTPASSEDNLINPQSNPPSEVSSPKTPKKRSETSRNLIFSLLKRSSTVKEEEQRQNSL